MAAPDLGAALAGAMAFIGPVAVRGLRELDRALGGLSKDLRKGMRNELRTVAEPVRVLAEDLAFGNIRNIGLAWSQMRLGVTSRYVYIAPKARRHGGRPRPNLAPLLLHEMEQAVDEKKDEVIKGLEGWLDGLSVKQGF